MKPILRLLSRHKFLATLLLLFVLELAALPVVYWRYAIRDFPAHSFVDDFIVARLALGGLIKPPITKGAPQNYVGNIATNPTNWGKIFPADTLLGWRPAPNLIVRHAFEALYYITNAQGFAVTKRLDETYAVPKGDDVFRIIVLGGSTVMGGGVRDSRQSFPARMSDHLSTAPFLAGKTVEVINAGVVGYDLNQAYLYLLTELIEYDPDLVVLYFGLAEPKFNALFNRSPGASRPFRSFEAEQLNTRLNSTFSMAGNVFNFAGNFLVGIGELWSQSGLGHIIRSAAHKVGVNLVFGAASGPGKSPDEIRYNPRASKHLASMLRAFADLAENRKFRFSMFYQPTALTSDKPYSDFERGYIADVLARDPSRTQYQKMEVKFRKSAVQAMEEIEQNFSADRLICAADVSDVFAATKETVYIDLGHLNEVGEDILARRLTKELKACWPS